MGENNGRLVDSPWNADHWGISFAIGGLPWEMLKFLVCLSVILIFLNTILFIICVDLSPIR